MVKKGIFYFLGFILFFSLGILVLNITGYVSQGEAKSSVSIEGLRILYSNFNGSTTEFNSLSTEELNNLLFMELERSSYGKVFWNDAVNLTLTGGERRLVDFNSYLNISQNLIYIDSDELPYLNKSVNITLRGLSFLNPQIMKGGSVCEDCEILSYSGGELVFNSLIFSDAYYVRETPVSAPVCGNGVCEEGEDKSNCPVDCSDEDGGEETSTVVDPLIPELDKDFYVLPSFFASEFKKGQYSQKEILIVNNGSESLKINIVIQNLSEFIFPETDSLIVGAGENKTLRLNIYASNYANPDVYFGSVLFISGSILKETKAILDIKDKHALFDIRAEVIKRYVNIGSKVRANITIVNVGDLRNFDVSLEYKILDFEGKEYTLKKEDFAINQSFQGIFSLELPEDIPIGDYLFYAKVYAGDVTASSYDTFVVEKISFLSWIVLILLVLILMGIILVHLRREGINWFAFLKRRKKEKEEIDEPQVKRKLFRKYGRKVENESTKERSSLIDIARSKGI